MPTRVSVHPGRPCACSAKIGRMMNMPNKRSPKIEASEMLARSSPGVMRAAEFTSKRGVEQRRKAAL
jgi:hypothetical protein